MAAMQRTQNFRPVAPDERFGAQRVVNPKVISRRQVPVRAVRIDAVVNRLFGAIKQHTHSLKEA